MSDVVKLSNSFAEFNEHVEGIDLIDEQTMTLIGEVMNLSPMEYTNGDCIDLIEDLIENYHLWHKIDAGESIDL
jgi:hypothetical protein